MHLIPRTSLLDIDAVFDNFFAPMANKPSLNGPFTPRVDVRETANGYEISAELPGVKKEDLTVAVDQGVLSIEAESRFENQEEKTGKLVRQERRYGKFSRSFTLGSGIDENAISARFENGVLTLVAPKVIEQTPEKRQVEIH